MSLGLNLTSDPWLREYQLAEEMVQEISASIQVLLSFGCFLIMTSLPLGA